MSYSFSVRGLTKALALDRAEEAFKKVLESQPVHGADEATARKAREEAVSLLGEPGDGKEFYISCAGSLSWEGVYPTDHRLTGASVNVYVSHQPTEAPKA